MTTARQRLAAAADVDAIAALMRESVLALFPRFYSPAQTASGAVHIAHLDPQLITDGTYFLHEADAEVVACGGWSRRAKLYTGSGDHGDDARLLDPETEPGRVRAMFVRQDWTRRGIGREILAACERAAADEGFRAFTLMATLPGVLLYRAFGFTEVRRVDIPLPDGVTLAGVEMHKPIAR